jgi:glucose dehydrogenase
MTARAYLGAAALLAVGAAVAACTSSSADAPTTVTNPKVAKPAGSWPYPNGDAENTRDAADSTISSAKIASLKQAWTFKLPAAEVPSGPSFGSMAATPIVTGRTILPGSTARWTRAAGAAEAEAIGELC